jgi:hypothetical protein
MGTGPTRSGFVTDEPNSTLDWLPVQISGSSWRVSVKLGELDGEIRLVGLRLEPADPLEPAEISEEALRAIPFGEVAKKALETASDAKGREGTPGPPRNAWVARHYEEIAAAYREAETSGQNPNAYVRERWSVSRGTAEQWIARAGELGLITPSNVANSSRPSSSRRSGRRR